MPAKVAKKFDGFADNVKCPIESESHFQHDATIIKVRDQVTRADEAVRKAIDRIKELKATQLVPETEKDRTSQVLAQRVYELQKANIYLRGRLGLKEER